MAVQLRLWANGHVESFHGKLRDECLNTSWFRNLFDARKQIAAWKRDYNEQRPHSSLQYQTPAEFAKSVSSPSTLLHNRRADDLNATLRARSARHCRRLPLRGRELFMRAKPQTNSA